MSAFALAVFKLAAGLLLDRRFGEFRRYHPLVGFGRWASAIESRVRGHSASRLAGIVAWVAATGPWLGLALLLRELHPQAHWVVDIGLLYFALGARSLTEHAEAIAAPLESGDLAQARTRTAWIVSRDTARLDAEGIARAGTESVLENGNDAVFGALFWFLIFGGPGALLFRLANTLDAMWGYRTPRYLRFGWAAARIDDVLNAVPARLTALTYAVLGRTRQSLHCWREQAPAWDSPNAGPVMAAGAGALDVALGGVAIYHGKAEARPPLGTSTAPDAGSIRAAVELVHRGMLLWLAISALLAFALEQWNA
ncbi:cobalamin biosynthesis protein [Azoarcus sp. L1K30]|uniref:adenosylcobinamide-phosphate synthase CbiB n=1 Tax=Azoarcus sp. L1K30 TaxID=2820277 RepID=UPI001B821B01|nr:adenosylcobinamide-phosphate synthase CbiB [Azoarcus sp. L1K30]MBR0568039.1 cobalamin biosynthesis protein [Azoarcus sp. L1K30]